MPAAPPPPRPLWISYRHAAPGDARATLACDRCGMRVELAPPAHPSAAFVPAGHAFAAAHGGCPATAASLARAVRGQLRPAPRVAPDALDRARAFARDLAAWGQRTPRRIRRAPLDLARLGALDLGALAPAAWAVAAALDALGADVPAAADLAALTEGGVPAPPAALLAGLLAGAAHWRAAAALGLAVPRPPRDPADERAPPRPPPRALVGRRFATLADPHARWLDAAAAGAWVLGVDDDALVVATPQPRAAAGH